MSRCEDRAVIFDCDGVLADTERLGHLPAFNKMFEEFGLPVRWTAEEYERLLLIGGGKERLETLLTEEFVAVTGLSQARSEQLAALRRWHERKTEIYADIVASGGVQGRPGVARIIDAALTAGWKVAVASTSTEASVRAVLDRVVGRTCAARIPVFAGDLAPRKKPAPDIYRLAIEGLGVAAGSAIAIEDSRNGLLAATAAGLACVVTVNSFAVAEDFSEAVLVVDSLGDPGGERTTVHANRGRALPGPFLTLDDLADSMSIGVTA